MKIKELKANIENLHYPIIILDDGTQTNALTVSLRAVYKISALKDLCAELIGLDWRPQEIFNYEREQAKKELFPVLIKAFEQDKRYNKLSLKEKGYYNILKEYDLIEELKGGKA
jgi:hypothetical protein